MSLPRRHDVRYLTPAKEQAVQTMVDSFIRVDSTEQSGHKTIYFASGDSGTVSAIKNA